MKKKQNKSLLALVLVALLLTIAVSGTLAYLVDRTQTVTNTFTPTQVDIEVKDDYKIENVNNPKNVDAYVRAAVLVNWKLGNDVFGEVPTGYSWEIGTDWEKAADGFYYYKKKLPVGSVTPALVVDFQKGTASAPATEFELTVEILAQAIQAEPDSVVETVWSSGVSDANNGTLTIKPASSGN